MMRLELITWLFCQLSSSRSFSSFHPSDIRIIRSSSRLLLQNKDSLTGGGVSEWSDNKDKTVTILERGPSHIVAVKPPSVVCHHSGWTGSRSKQKRGEEPEIPMLQRVRDAIHDIDSQGVSSGQAPIRRVNLVHRLDRGASGALLLAFADDGDTDEEESTKGPTADLIEAMSSPKSIKTYVALVRGEVSIHRSFI